MNNNNKILIWGGVVLVILIAIIAIVAVLQRRPVALTLTSDPSQVDVFINNQTYHTPTTIKIKPGQYTIWAAKTGYLVYQKDFAVKSFTSNSLKITLQVDPDANVQTGGDVGQPAPKIQLPNSTDHFKVDYGPNGGATYLITPNIPFTANDTPENQISDNWQLYVQYGKEALSWLRSQGVSPTSQNIVWWGQEWWPSGATAPSL